MEEVEIKRLIWHSRRGMLELDLLLEPFARQELAHLSDQEQNHYAQLLTHQDPDIYAWLTRQEVCSDPQLLPLIAKIQAYAATARTH